MPRLVFTRALQAWLDMYGRRITTPLRKCACVVRLSSEGRPRSAWLSTRRDSREPDWDLAKSDPRAALQSWFDELHARKSARESQITEQQRVKYQGLVYEKFMQTRAQNRSSLNRIGLAVAAIVGEQRHQSSWGQFPGRATTNASTLPLGYLSFRSLFSCPKRNDTTIVIRGCVRHGIASTEPKLFRSFGSCMRSSHSRWKTRSIVEHISVGCCEFDSRSVSVPARVVVSFHLPT
jgi:hypothetical protein